MGGVLRGILVVLSDRLKINPNYKLTSVLQFAWTQTSEALTKSCNLGQKVA